MSQNYYLLLDLPLDPPELNWSAIEKRIEEKQRQWSKETTDNPRKAMFAKQSLEQIADMRLVLKDENKRKELAAEALNIWKQDQETARLALHEAVRMASLKGHLSEDEIPLLAKKHKVTETEVRAIAKVPIQPVETPETQLLDKSKARNIRERLALVGHSSLYDFLGLNSGSSAKALEEKAKEKDAEIRSNANKTAELTAAGELVGHCFDLFADKDKRAAYDASLAYERLAELDNAMEAVGLTKKIAPQAYDELMRLGIELGLNEQQAAQHIESYAAKRKWAVQIPGELTVSRMRKCGSCNRFSESNKRNCGHCGFPLEVICPQCGTAEPSEHRTCASCGFALGDMPNALALVTEGQLAYGADKLDEAAKAFRQALVYWPDHIEATQKLKLIENRLQARLDIEKQLAQALSKRHYYKAQGLLVDLKKQLGQDSHPRDKEVYTAISAAEEHVRAAQSQENPDLAMDAWFAALECCADHPTASEGMKSVPPSPPASIHQIEDHHQLVLAWEASPSKGVEGYCLVRKGGSRPQNARDGKLMMEGRDLQFTDSSAVLGESYYYAVFAIRGGTPSVTGAVIGPLMCVGEVEDLAIKPGDGRLTLSWHMSGKAKRVEVYRIQGTERPDPQSLQALSGVQKTGLTDGNLSNDQRYTYLVRSIFSDLSGREHTSLGVTLTGVPVQRPDEVTGLSLKELDDALQITWNPPNSGLVEIYPSKKERKMPREMAVGALASLGEALPVHTKGQVSYKKPQKLAKLWFYPITLAGDLAVPGTPLVWSNLGDITDAQFFVEQREKNKVLGLRWTWPEFGSKCLFYMDREAFPKDRDPEKRLTKVAGTRKPGAKTGQAILGNLSSDRLYFRAFMQGQDLGQEILSTGCDLLFEREKAMEVVDTRSSPLRFRVVIDKALWFSTYNDAWLYFWKEQGEEWISGGRLLKKKSAPPQNQEDGEVVAEIPSLLVSTTPTRLRLPLEILEKNALAGLFLEGPKGFLPARPENKTAHQLY